MSCCWQERTRGQISSVIGDLPLRAVSITPVRRWHESPGRVFGRADAASGCLTSAADSNTEHIYKSEHFSSQRMRSETFSCFSLIKLYFHTLKLERFDPCGSLIEFMWRLVRWPPGCGCFPGASACSSASSRGEVMAVHPELRGSNGFYSTLWLLGGSLNSRSNTSVMMLLSVSLRWVTPHRKSSAPPALLRIKHWSFSWCWYDLHV